MRDRTKNHEAKLQKKLERKKEKQKKKEFRRLRRLRGEKMTKERKADVKNGIARMVFSGLVIIAVCNFIIITFTRLYNVSVYVRIVTITIGLGVSLILYSKPKTSSMKIPWIILILILPPLGLGLYLIVGFNSGTFIMRRRYEKVKSYLMPELNDRKIGIKRDQDYLKLKNEDPQLANISRYLIDYSGFPVYQNTDIVYFDDASKALNAQKEALRRAQKFIFMEYHAIEDKEAWWGIQKILEERVRAGVEVRVFYDDMGSIGFINTDFVKRMKEVGINCRVFNPFMPGLNVFLNNRDHRKITVIDGKIGFTGGYNLANEYFNITHPYGNWKDTGIKLIGEAVRSMTITFLENWNAVKEGDPKDMDFKKYLPDVNYKAQEEGVFIQPYADSPLDNERVGEEVYISMANKASRYCWFITPYLILTDEMRHALCLAAKRGVDVRIITPGIPDKKLVYMVTRSYYNALARDGVRIYEWTPGFCHCKMSVADDKAATCGTINLDYRSLYHHFENGCLYMHTKAVLDTKDDFIRIMQQSREVTLDYKVGRKKTMRVIQLILRLFSPLL